MPLVFDTGTVVKEGASAATEVTIETEVKNSGMKEADINTEVIEMDRKRFPDGYIVVGISNSLKLSHNWNSAGISVNVNVPLDINTTDNKHILAALDRAEGLGGQYLDKHLPVMTEMLKKIQL